MLEINVVLELCLWVVLCVVLPHYNKSLSAVSLIRFYNSIFAWYKMIFYINFNVEKHIRLFYNKSFVCYSNIKYQYQYPSELDYFDIININIKANFRYQSNTTNDM